MKKSRKMGKQIFSVLLAVAMVFACTPVSVDAAKKPKLSKTSATLRVGKKLTLKVKNTKKKAKWSIQSGKKYITLKKKKKTSVIVQAKKAGTAKVAAKIGKKKLVCKIKVKRSNASAEDNDPVGNDATPTPAQPAAPTQVPEPGKTPGQSSGPDPAKTPGQSTPDPVKTPEPEESEIPGENVELPSGATVFTLGTKKLALGMSGTDVYKVLGSSSHQEIRTGRAPQGFDTIAYNTNDYSEYLLIYLKNNLVTGICGIGKAMNFGDASAGQNGNNLDGNWRDNSAYRTASGNVGAKKSNGAGNETVYAFYDALGDNSIYCIQIFDSTQVVDQDNDMIYMTENLTYGETVNSSIATEIGKMLNAFRAYRSLSYYYLNDGLARCAQDYCATITASKIDPRNADSLLEILQGYGVDPMNWGEVCYYDAADAISFANSIIEMDAFYNALLKDSSPYRYIGAGMASNGKHTYLTIDYVDEI